MTEKPLRAFIDRIEGETAILLVGEEGHLLQIPIRYLPRGVEEGTVVSVCFEIDAEATADARENIAGLIKRLQRRKI